MVMRLRKELSHICFDGCMFPSAVMENPKTWSGILDLADGITAELIRQGLPADRAPKVHTGAWSRVVGRGPGSDLGHFYSLDCLLSWVTSARSRLNRRFDGIDVMEGADMSADASTDELGTLAAALRKNQLVVGDIVASTWPDAAKGEHGAFGSDADRERMVAAVDRACRLWHRFKLAGVASYGAIRIDSGEGPEAYDAAGHYALQRLLMFLKM